MLNGLFQPMHLVLVLVIAVIIFGPRKLPELGAGIGKSIREFKKAMSEHDNPTIENKSAEVKTEGKT
jgi:sec-independent protein translocase protein TatA